MVCPACVLKSIESKLCTSVEQVWSTSPTYLQTQNFTKTWINRLILIGSIHKPRYFFSQGVHHWCVALKFNLKRATPDTAFTGHKSAHCQPPLLLHNSENSTKKHGEKCTMHDQQICCCFVGRLPLKLRKHRMPGIARWNRRRIWTITLKILLSIQRRKHTKALNAESMTT